MKVFYFPVCYAVVQLLSFVYTQQASLPALESAEYFTDGCRECLERSSVHFEPPPPSGSSTGLRGSVAYLELTVGPTVRATSSPTANLNPLSTSQPSSRPTSKTSSRDAKYNIFNRNLGLIVGIVVGGIFVLVVLRKFYNKCLVTQQRPSS